MWENYGVGDPQELLNQKLTIESRGGMPWLNKIYSLGVLVMKEPMKGSAAVAPGVVWRRFRHVYIIKATCFISLE